MKVDIHSFDVEAPEIDPVVFQATPARQTRARGGPFSSALAMASSTGSVTQDTQVQNYSEQQTYNWGILPLLCEAFWLLVGMALLIAGIVSIIKSFSRASMFLLIFGGLILLVIIVRHCLVLPLLVGMGLFIAGIVGMRYSCGSSGCDGVDNWVNDVGLAGFLSGVVIFVAVFFHAVCFWRHCQEQQATGDLFSVSYSVHELPVSS